MDKHVAKLLSNVEHDEASGCWNHLGALDDMGRTHCTFRGVSERSHRQAFRMFHGPIPQGYCVCHSCDNPRCVNPRHLWLGTRAENSADMARKGRAARLRKITPKMEERIKALACEGLSYREIGGLVGVHGHTCRLIATGRYVRVL